MKERAIHKAEPRLDRGRQRLLLGVTLAAMAAALLVAAGFTLLSSRVMSGLHLAVSLLWLIGLVVLVWGAAVGRILPVRGQPHQPAWYHLPGTVRLAIAFALASIGWMAAARIAGPASMMQSIHWPVQLVLLLGFIGLAAWLMLRRKRNGQDDPEALLQALEQRDRVLRGIARLSESTWLERAEPLTPQGRLRTTLRWWGEELVDALPSNGQMLLRSPYNRVAYEADRLLAALQDLGRTNEQDERRISEAEIEVLSAIESASTVLARSAP